VGAHRHPCAQRAISAASGHSNANEQSCTACVCQHLASHLRLSPPPAERESALPCSALLCPALPVLLDCSSLQLSPSITTAGPSGLVVDTQTQQPFHLSSLHRTAPHRTALHRTAPHSPSASLPGFASLDRTCRAPESTPTTAFRPALPHLQSLARLLRVSTRQRQTPRRTHHGPACAHQLISYLSPPRTPRHHCTAACDPARPRCICDSLGSTALARRQRQHLDSLQPFACGRPIHLATSSPNERAETSALLLCG
jgi:hypothetical protein